LEEVDENNVIKAAKILKNLQDSEYGTYFLNENQEHSSAYYAGLALSAFSKVYDLIDNADQESITDLIGEVLKSIEGQLFFSHFDNSLSDLKTTSILLRGLVDLAAVAGEIAVEDVQISQMASYIITQKYISSLEETYSLLVGLEAANRGIFKKPLVLTLSNNVVYASSKSDDDVKIQFTDLFGKPITDKIRLYVDRAYPLGYEENALVSLRNQEVPFLKDNIYSLNFLVARPEPGTYVLDFRSIHQDGKFLQIESAKRSILVVVKAEISEFELAVTDTAEIESDSQKQSISPGKELKSKIKLKENQYLHASFKVRSTASGRPLLIHQSVLKLTNSRTKENFYFVVKPTTNRLYTITIDVSEHINLLSNSSGTYELTLIVGDSYIEKSIAWKCAELDVIFTGVDERKVLDPYAKKPVIEHKFRTPEKEADAYITNLFCVLLVIPFLFLLLQLIRYGNMSGLPSGINSLHSLLFIISVSVLLGLNILYWYEMKFLDAVFYLAIVSVPTAFFGKKTLSSIAHRREKLKQE